MFKSTNEIYIITRCNNYGSACGNFEFDYSKVELEKVEPDFPEWSMIITIYIGFSLMLLSFLYFEWRCALNCFRRCLSRCGKGKNQSNTVYDEVNEGKIDQGYRQNSNENRGKNNEDMEFDDQVLYGLDRLTAKNKKNENSYGENHGFDGHDYASNR